MNTNKLLALPLIVLFSCLSTSNTSKPIDASVVGGMENHETQESSSPVEPNIPIEDNAAPVSGHCSADMIEIEGEYCPNVSQECLQWVDIDGKPTDPPVNTSGRCGVWKNPQRCLSPHTVHKHYCIDTYEFPNKKGVVPQDWMSWYDAKNACEGLGKRLCTRSEWSFAAEGKNMHPYPYGDGYHRDKTACNFDNHNHGIDVFKATNPNTPEAIQLHNLLVPSGSMERCVGDFGVREMVGNIDEWVINETGHPYVSGLMGGHVFGVRNASFYMTDAHGPDFKWYETGTRCCSNSQQ